MDFRHDLFVYSCFINAALSGGMAAFVLLSRPLTRVKSLWSLMCLSCFLWCFGMGFTANTSDFTLANLGFKIAYIGVIIIPVSLFHSISEILHQSYPRILNASYFSMVVLEILLFTGGIGTVEPFGPFDFYIKATWPGYTLFSIYFFGLIGFTVWILWQAYRKSSGLFKKQLGPMFWGLTFGLVGGFSFMPYKFGINVFPYGCILVPLYVLLIGFGMFRYELMGYKLILKRFAFALAVYASLCLLAIFLLWPVYVNLARLSPEAKNLALIFGLGSAFVLSFGPLLYAYGARTSAWFSNQSATGLAHELKSPLGAIRGALEMLEENGAGKPSPYLEMIDRNVDRLENYVSDLLSIATFQKGETTVKKAPLNLTEVCEEAWTPFRPAAARKGVQFRGPKGEFVIEGDRNKLGQVFSNVFSNALKFSKDGEILTRFIKENGHIKVEVSDQGAGIPQAHLKNIFRTFFQSETTAKGSGIGLTIAKGWVEAHGGEIWAESEGEGKGTRVSFTLPTH